MCPFIGVGVCGCVLHLICTSSKCLIKSQIEAYIQEYVCRNQSVYV